MKKLFAVSAAVALLGLSVTAQADVFNLGGTRNPDGSWSGLASLETVTVGDPGNAPDTTGFGSVPYTYKVGKYEVTAGQYCAFLNAVARTDTYGLYNGQMDTSVNPYGCNIKRTGASGSYYYSVAPDWANRPVNYVSFWDACRFANWLHNGQPSGAQNLTTTEDGAYFLNGYTGADGKDVKRKPGLKWAVTSEDEWYKAAYYKGGGASSGYWQNPTQSNTTPTNKMAEPDPGNNASFYNNGYTIGSPYYRTEAGAHENSSAAYGTFDQGGNVWEWNEGIPNVGPTWVCRGIRGGSFNDIGYVLESAYRNHYYPDCEFYSIGFRIAQVPEPSAIVVLLGSLAGFVGLTRRRA